MSSKRVASLSLASCSSNISDIGNIFTMSTNKLISNYANEPRQSRQIQFVYK